MILLNAIFVLVRMRLLIARNTFWRGRIGRKIALTLLTVVLLAGAWGMYWLSGVVVRFIASSYFADLLRQAAESNPGLPTDIAPVLVAVPATVFFGATLLLLFSSFSNILSALYLSGDIDMLLVAPVPMRAVFVVKFFGALVPQYTVLFLLLGPALLGYGQGLGYGALYVIVTLLVLLLLPLLPAGLGALLVMAVVRVLPARRARDIIGVLGGMLGVSWYILNQFAPEIAPRIANIRNVNALLRLNLPLLPSAWAGRALIAAGERQWLTLLAYGGLFVLLSLLVFGACLLLAERLYYLGWSNLAGQGGRVRSRRKTTDEGRTVLSDSSPMVKRFAPFVFRLSSFVLPPESAAILRKDLRLFPRDLRNLQQLIFPLALAGIWTFRLFSGGQQAPQRGEPVLLASLAGVGIAFFLCLSLANVLAGPGISREGRSFWLLKVAPISAMQIVLGKLALAYTPYPTVGTFFLLLLAVLRHAPVITFGHDLVLLLLLGFGCTAISMGMGAAFPQLNWERPNQQTTFRTGLFAPLFYLMYLALAVAAVVGLPLFGAWMAGGWEGLTGAAGAGAAGAAATEGLPYVVVGWVVAVGLTVGVSWGALRFGAGRLERIEV